MTGQPGLHTGYAGSERLWRKISRERLTANDLYHFIDWVRDGWNEDELFVTPRLQRLKWHLEELPDPYRSQALEQYAIIVRSRIAANVPGFAALAQVRQIVSAWDRSRPALEVCGIEGCMISYRSRDALREHRRLVHDVAA